MEKGLLVKDQAGGRAMAMFTAAAKDDNSNTREVQLVSNVGRTPSMALWASFWCGDITPSVTPHTLTRVNNFFPINDTLLTAGITPHEHMGCQYFEEVLNGGDDDAVFLIGGSTREVHAVIPNWATDTDFNEGNWSYSLNVLPDLPGTMATEIVATADIGGLLYVVDILGHVASIDPYDPIDWTVYSAVAPYYNWAYASFGDLFCMPDGTWLYKPWGYNSSGDSRVYTTQDLNSAWTVIDDTNDYYHPMMLQDGRILRIDNTLKGILVSGYANNSTFFMNDNNPGVWQQLPSPYGSGWYDASVGLTYLWDGIYAVNSYNIVKLTMNQDLGTFGTAWELIGRKFKPGFNDQTLLASQRSCITSNKYSWFVTSGGWAYNAGWVPAPQPALFKVITPRWDDFTVYDCADMSKIRLTIRCDDTFDGTSLKMYPVLLDANFNPVTRLESKTLTFGPLGNLISSNEYHCGSLEWDIVGYYSVAFIPEDLVGTTGMINIYAEIF